MNHSEHHRYFFLHIPKTAGSSLRNFLTSVFPRSFPTPGMLADCGGASPDYAQVLGIPPADYANFDFYFGHYSMLFFSRIPEPRICLTVLREPRARLISALRHRTRTMRRTGVQRGADDPLDIDSAAALPVDHGRDLQEHGHLAQQVIRRNLRESDGETIEAVLLDEQAEPFLTWLVHRPMAQIAHDSMDTSLYEPLGDSQVAKAYENLAAIEWVGIQENIMPFFEGVRHALASRHPDRSIPKCLPKDNVAPPFDETVLSSRARSRLDSLCKTEIDFYRFGQALANDCWTKRCEAR